MSDYNCEQDLEQMQIMLNHNPGIINSKNSKGKTLLHLASQFDDSRTVELLIKNGADVNTKDNNGSTPLHYASKYGNINVLKMLIKYDANANEKDNDGCIPLYYASLYDHCEESNILLNYSKINIENNKEMMNHTILLIALVFLRLYKEINKQD